MTDAAFADRPHPSRRPACRPDRRRLGGRPPRLHGAALSASASTSTRLLRLRRGVLLGAARHRPLRRHGGRHDLRHRQQGPRPVGRLDPRPRRDRLLDRLRAVPSRPGDRPGDPLRASSSALVIGLVNGWLVTVLRVPAFIATLTMLFIGRGFVARPHRRQDHLLSSRRRRSIPGSSRSARPTRCGFNNQILILFLVAIVGAIVLGQDPHRLRDLCRRRQRDGRDLCRHPHALGAHARLPLRRARARPSPA